MKKLLQLFGFLLLYNMCYGQSILNNDSIRKIDQDSVKWILKHAPAFSMYKDNYIITGTTLGETPTKDNSDVKLQFSFQQRILNEPIGKRIYSYFTYTQKTFWDIYKDSRPFNETNYNPGLLLVMPTFKHHQFEGTLTFSIEHESNGKDSIYSRSWNFVSLGYGHIFSPKLVIGLKVWLPFVGSENPDLIEYIGYGEAQIQWSMIQDRLFLNWILRKGASSDWKGSMQTTISYRPFANKTFNLMLQWWQGYAESLIDYKEQRGMLRIGLLFTPSYLRFY